MRRLLCWKYNVYYCIVYALAPTIGNSIDKKKIKVP